MIKNYFKIALRTLWRSKSFSFINIMGLAVGMASAMLILLWIDHEFSYDQFHRNKDYLYEAWNRAVVDGKIQCWSSTPKILGPTLKQEYPEIAAVARGNSRWFVTGVGNKKISTKALVTDPTFLSMFSFPFLKGDCKTALSNIYSIVITEEMEKKMFGDKDAMGKIITINHDDFIVTGILKNLPTNSSIDFEYLLPWAYMSKLGQDDKYWGNNSINTYVQLTTNATNGLVDQKIKDITKSHSNGVELAEVFLHPLIKWHLYSEFENGKIAGGRIEIVRLFGIIAACVLLIACINFMNLSTARSEKRAKEVGIRKVAGANKGVLVSQFLCESIFMSFISGIIALFLVQIFIGPFNSLVNMNLSLPYDRSYFWAFVVGFILFTGIVAGIYPAFFLSSFRPKSVLKGSFKRVHSAVNPRKLLVLLQFSFAIILIISTLIVMEQIKFVQARETGFNRDQLVYHWITGELGRNYPLVKNELLSSGAAVDATQASSPLTDKFSDDWDIHWKGKGLNDNTHFDLFNEDEGLVKTAGLKLILGRDMDLESFPSDSSAVILNESAARTMGFKNPVGQRIRHGLEFHVIGVIKDFLMGSPFELTHPMVIEGAKERNVFNVILIKLNPIKDPSQNLKNIENIFKKYNPEYPFEFHFVNLDYAKKFEDMNRTAIFTGLFTGLTLFISCLGLFGLALYMAESRLKEIGIRKVLGASVLVVAALLSKEFLKLVILSILTASPIAWYTMHKWLEGYSYHTSINCWFFVAAGLSALFLAGFTVSFQAIKAAMANPVNNLRRE